MELSHRLDLSQPSAIAPAQIILDPSGRYDCGAGFEVITTERQWLERMTTAGGRWWVQGEHLCTWTRLWLRAHQCEQQIGVEMRSPRSEMQQIVAPLDLPPDWTEADCLALLNTLHRYALDDPQRAIAHHLAHLSHSDPDFWLAPPSRDHLAAWLAVEVPPEGEFLQQVWQHQRPASPAAAHYHTPNKRQHLKRWLGIAAEPPLPEWGPYPHPIPAGMRAEFEQYWRSRVITTQGEALDHLQPDTQPHLDAIAPVAYTALLEHPHALTPERQALLSPHLTAAQRQTLGDRTPPALPSPLSPTASPREALTWATEDYLPFRRWEKLYTHERHSEAIAASFVTWLLEHYPALTHDPVANSLLNYSVTDQVQTYAQQQPVLWVVVDGLGWLDHHDLVNHLIETHNLRLETDIQPRFSLLPTTTQYAKWSLYSRRLPHHESWSPDLNDAFQTLNIGQRYTDHTLSELTQAIQQQAHSLYCWDTILLDKLYHDQRDWQYCYKTERSIKLQEIAQKIAHLLNSAPNAEPFKLIIASDHGQMFGPSPPLSLPATDLQWHGRITDGVVEHPQVVTLDAQRYHLPHAMSVIRTAAAVNAFHRTADNDIIGAHGGLFPEEVVLGFSVLSATVHYLPPVATLSGTGTAGEPGDLTLTISNLNPLSIHQLSLSFDPSLPDLRCDRITESVAGQAQKTIKIHLHQFPSLDSNNQGSPLKLRGTLSFIDANHTSRSVEFSPSSCLTINQDYITGLPENIFNEFLS